MRYLEFSRFMRNLMESRDMNVSQMAWSCGGHIRPRRFYDFLEGVRVPMGWEVTLIQQRLGITIPWRYLRGEDRYGAQKKNFDKRQLHLPGLRKAS